MSKWLEALGTLEEIGINDFDEMELAPNYIGLRKGAIDLFPNHFKAIRQDLERLEKLEKVVNDFLEYLSKEPNRTISKHSIKQTFDKLLKEVFGNENS